MKTNGKNNNNNKRSKQSFFGTDRVYCVFNMNVINLYICLLYEQTQSKTRISFAEKEKHHTQSRPTFKCVLCVYKDWVVWKQCAVRTHLIHILWMWCKNHSNFFLLIWPALLAICSDFIPIWRYCEAHTFFDWLWTARSRNQIVAENNCL